MNIFLLWSLTKLIIFIPMTLLGLSCYQKNVKAFLFCNIKFLFFGLLRNLLSNFVDHYVCAKLQITSIGNLNELLQSS